MIYRAHKKWLGVLIINMLMLKLFPVPVLCFQKCTKYRAFKLIYNRGNSDYIWVFGVYCKLGLWVESLVTYITFDVFMPVNVYGELSPVICSLGALGIIVLKLLETCIMDFFGMLLKWLFIYERLIAHLAPIWIIIMDSLYMLVQQRLLWVSVFATLPSTRVSPSSVTFFLLLG